MSPTTSSMSDCSKEKRGQVHLIDVASHAVYRATHHAPKAKKRGAKKRGAGEKRWGRKGAGEKRCQERMACSLVVSLMWQSFARHSAWDL